MSRVGMSRCAKTEQATNGAWRCVREIGHTGPCAAESALIQGLAQCGAAWSNLDELLGTKGAVRCILEHGHGGSHSGRVTW